MAWEELSEEHRMLRDLVTKFVERELMPLEPAVLARETGGGKIALTPEEEGPLRAKAKELGLWGLDVPEEFGGADLPVLPLMAVEEEMGRTLTPFIFPPDSPNLHMMLQVASSWQRERYLEPYARGEATSCIAISEPGAGGDPAGMTTRAVQDGDDWVINGRKIWTSGAESSEYCTVCSVTLPAWARTISSVRSLYVPTMLPITFFSPATKSSVGAWNCPPYPRTNW